MKKLTQQANFFLTAVILAIALSVMLLLLGIPVLKGFLPVFLSAALVFAVFYEKALKTIADARLIVENQILYIQPAVIFEQAPAKKAGKLTGETFEIFVSCFGILLDGRVIRFNRGKIRLKAVELGRDYIGLTYGTAEKEQQARLLCPAFGEEEEAGIARKFHDETGITVVHANWKSLTVEKGLDSAAGT
ncbi:MAG: hypothetical protein DDT21_02238 [Syntrophomonadaceae bacterium]|nr:hypothetical protein [Bacillota bacterium]